MSRDDDKLIHYWIGKGKQDPVKWYKSSDSDAITLLPVLVERGYNTLLLSTVRGWSVVVTGNSSEIPVFGTTISQAICSAILEVIRKESKR